MAVPMFKNHFLVKSPYLSVKYPLGFGYQYSGGLAFTRQGSNVVFRNMDINILDIKFATFSVLVLELSKLVATISKSALKMRITNIMATDKPTFLTRSSTYSLQNLAV